MVGSTTTSIDGASPQVSSEPSDHTYQNLLAILMHGGPKWGWEYLGPPTLQRYPVPQPSSQYVTGPDVTTALRRLDKWKNSRRVWRVIITLFLLSIGAASPALLTIGLAYAAWAFGPALAARARLSSARSTYDRDVAVEEQRHRAAYADWDQRRAEFEAQQRSAQGRAPVWFPVAPPQRTRVDVVGGEAGWPELTAMVGCSVLGSGGSLFVLDLTGDDIAAGLARMAEDDAAVPVVQNFLPEGAPTVDLLGGLAAADVAEVLFDAARDIGEHRGELRAHHVELVRIVVDRLDAAPITLPRVIAGLEVLRRNLDPDDHRLSATEFTAINTKIDLAGTDPATVDRLSNLVAKLRELGELGTHARSPYHLNSTGLQVLALAPARTHEQRRFATRLAVLWLIHELAGTRAERRPAWVVVSGADELGHATLELLAGTAARVGVRLLLQFAHLRDDVAPMIGTSESATLFMRLGNGQEALKAAEHIGREHKFVLNSITRTHGTNTAYQTGHSDSEAFGESQGIGGGPGGRSWNRGISQTTTWTRNVSTTSGSSESDATTEQRTYEFSVEPTELQNLARTAFLLVADQSGRRRVVAGDAFPGIALMPRLADSPATEPDRQMRAGLGDGAAASASGVPGPPQPMTTVTIVDPTGAMTAGIQGLAQYGYTVEWHQDPKPMLSGWRVTAPAGGVLDTDQVMRYIRQHS